jgi:NAD(P)-dependent dehydrogenase (short-subunit alcohol dehydrogenase family)
LRLDGRTFVVTGGRSGLGAAAVATLEDAGASAVVADLPECDVTDEAAVEHLVAQSHTVDGVICCAGIGGSARLLDFEAEQFRRIVDVNLVGTFLAVKHAVRRMAENEPDAEGGRGVVVMTASNAAFDGQIGQIAYSASKGGVVGMTLPLARDLARHGIRVVTIAPGPHDTPMLSRLRDDIRASLEAQVPFPKRLGRAEDFAAPVRHVIENDYLNGEVIRLDGALRMGPR